MFKMSENKMVLFGTKDNQLACSKRHNDIVHVILLIDASDSMAPYRAKVVSCVNNLIHEYKENVAKTLLTVAFFDSNVDVAIDCLDIASAEELSIWQYRTIGCTQMLDAIGDTIERNEWIHANVEEQYRPAKTFFVIVSDGGTHCDERYTERQVKAKIKSKIKDNWEFIYLGTEYDAVQNAKRLGIGQDNAAKYSLDSVANLYRGIASATRRGDKVLPAGQWKEEIIESNRLLAAKE